jgi:methionyl-tRNA synthetase
MIKKGGQMNKNIFITTTLPYPNSESGPHVGFLFESLIIDSINRFLKSKEYNTFFNTGIDEEGLKIYKKSLELGLTPIEYLDRVSPNYVSFLKSFNINYDNFYRTSNKNHSDSVQIIWNTLLEKGDIYKKKYKGLYCVGCESFKTDKDLENLICKDHPTIKIEEVQEENYFFKLSKYKDSLLEWISSNDNFIEPYSKKRELINLIIDIEDISISRNRINCPWGTIVPNDETQTVYIWFSALLNYIFAAGYLTNNFNWSYIIQTCGPDNLRFQGVIFQAILESLNIKKTDKLLVHGTILDKDGRKMSKTLGNTVDPIEQLEKWGLDAVKYYALCGLSTYSDSSWNEDDLVRLFNNDICNDWGNLVARTLHLVDIKNVNIEVVDDGFKEKINILVNDVENLWLEYRVKEALQKTNEIVKIGNKYINDEKPWSSENYNVILSNLYYLVKKVNDLYLPVFPTVNSICNDAIENRKKVILFNKLN